MKFPEIMMSKIPVSLREFLESRGFTCIAATYDEANFGDIVLDCTDSDLIIRVVKDRMQVFVDIANAQKPDEWHMLPDLITFLGGVDSQVEYIEQEQLASQLKAHYQDIKELLTGANARRVDLKQFEEKRREATFTAMLTTIKPS